jgi:hypothetical protein
MSSRSLGVVSLERFLAVERYRETHQAPRPTPTGLPNQAAGTIRSPGEPRRSNGTSGKAR